MSFSDIVDLYRQSGKPSVSGGKFSATFPFSLKIVETLKAIGPNDIDELQVDDNFYLLDDIPQEGTKISFECLLPKRSTAQFYNSFKHLLTQVYDFNKGIIPQEYYIIDEDFYTQDNVTEPTKLQTLKSISLLINRLSYLALYHDQKKSFEKCLRLVFIHPDFDQSIPPTVIETVITEEMLLLNPINTKLVESLTAENALENPHYNAEVGVFGTTIADFVSRYPDPQLAFLHLIQNWVEFTQLYHNNLHTYLSGFAFHKAKKEIAETEFSIAEQFSKVISEITGKLLSIPLSLAAVVAIVKSQSAGESLLVLCGLFIASLIISKVVKNQERQLERISHAKEVKFSSIEGKQQNFPIELSAEIKNMKDNLNKNERSLKDTLNTYGRLSWVPTIIALGVYIFHHSEVLLCKWQKVVMWALDAF